MDQITRGIAPNRRGKGVAALGAVALALGLTACSSPASEESPAGEETDSTPVTVALDWTTNTNHVGIYVAEELGYYEEAGLELEILPYASSPTTDLIESGSADFGVSTQAVVQQARTAGADLASVFAVVQKETGALVTLPDRDDIASPSDLDGKLYGGFGIPLYHKLAQQVIKNDGGQGDIEEVTLTTGAYDALEAGSIDFTAAITTWESILQEQAGQPFQVFEYEDFGIPNEQTILIATSDETISADPEKVEAFVQATQRGYQYTIDNREEAAQLLIDADTTTLGESEELVRASLDKLIDEGYFQNGDRAVGSHDPEAWDGFGGFLLESELLTDGSGEIVTEAPDWESYYTNEYL
ncbi:ABC transporter substrate-binding protein [Leucobacter weissii]|uniref:Thiamine pyrimidine synthase n=1 Tax=Leucobacter weissii TaxID=1983706 RepID=A0A939MJ55_9MICO|nr:ABC transporter substrate-binding protein [Leucobacter weissii]MBO1900960.1 ABC transporter substrate-binding protein [Leucobacter weissii]